MCLRVRATIEGSTTTSLHDYLFASTAHRLGYRLRWKLAFNSGSLIYVKFEIAVLNSAVRKDHLAEAVLYAPAPLPLIDRPVCPLHLTISVALVLSILSFICVATRPGEHAVSVFLVVKIVTFILVTRLWPFCTLPPAFAVLKTL